MKKKTPKPRNPFVQHLVKKKQGAHEKPYKTIRKNEKKILKEGIKYGKFDNDS